MANLRMLLYILSAGVFFSSASATVGANSLALIQRAASILKTKSAEAAVVRMEKVIAESEEQDLVLYPYPMFHAACDGKSVVQTVNMSVEVYERIVTDFEAMFANRSDEGIASLAGCMVRWAGHDMMDYDSTKNATGESGGQDGCFDFSDVNNAGLKSCFLENDIMQVWVDACEQVSLADFIVIAAEAVMMTRSDYLPRDFFMKHFKFGRVTAKQCPFSNGRMPDAEGACPAVEETFINKMGLKDWSEATALMGVHTLGRADTNNSGYEGSWSDVHNQAKFNNNYYISMISKPWFARPGVGGNPARNQWQCSDQVHCPGPYPQLMLDTDMCLVFKGEVIKTGNCLENTDEGATEHFHAKDSRCCAWVEFPGMMMKPNSNGIVKCPSLNRDPSFCMPLTNYTGDTCVFSEPPPWMKQHFAELETDYNMGDHTRGCHRTCGSARVPKGPGFETVKFFAANEGEWYGWFRYVWGKVVTNGWAQQLTPLVSGTPTLVRPKLGCDGVCPQPEWMAEGAPLINQGGRLVSANVVIQPIHENGMKGHNLTAKTQKKGLPMASAPSASHWPFSFR